MNKEFLDRFIEIAREEDIKDGDHSTLSCIPANAIGNANLLVKEDGKLSDISKKMMAGILDLADGLTAFGNTIPTSYLRLVPHQEAPTNICWGDRNRSALVRVPLGWLGVNNMILDANPSMCGEKMESVSKQTVEFRAPDGSADIHLLVAGLIVASQHGLEMENGLQKAEELYVGVNIFDEEHKDVQNKLEQLPTSCFESAERLEKKRAAFEKNDIFPAKVIDHTVNKLKAFEDKDLSERLYGKNEAIRELVLKHIHCQ
jgi:glutamine synthetase